MAHWLNLFPLTAVLRGSSSMRKPQLKINVALGKPASQSSTSNSKHVASKAVNGILMSDMDRCISTKSQYGAWWQVDLVAVYEIHTVVITSPSEKPNNIEILGLPHNKGMYTYVYMCVRASAATSYKYKTK